MSSLEVKTAEMSGPGRADTAKETWNELRRGFPVLITACLGAAVGMIGLSIYSLPFFVAPLQAEFGWSRREVLGAATAFTFGLIVTGPLVGRIIDRLGVHRVTPVSIALFALGWLALTQVHGNVWSLYAGYVALAVLGAGTAYIAYARAVSTWFDRARGLALGLTMSGPGVAAATAPLFLPTIISNYGWRMGYLALAGVASTALPLTLLFLRERSVSHTTAAVTTPAPGLTLAEAIRTRQFWFLLISLFLVSAAIIGTHLNLVPLINDRGGTPEKAAWAASLFGVSIIIGRIGVGLLLDRLPGRLVAALLFCGAAASLLLLQFGSMALVPLAAILLGLASGSESDVCGFLASRYFGLRAYSEVFGWMFSAIALGLAIGPVLGGALHEAFGDYRWWLIGGAGIALVAAALCLTLGPYPKFDEERA